MAAINAINVDQWFGPAGKRGFVLTVILMLLCAIAYQAKQINEREKQVQQLNRALVACEADKAQTERVHAQDKVDLILLMTDFEALQKEVDGVKQRVRRGMLKRKAAKKEGEN